MSASSQSEDKGKNSKILTQTQFCRNLTNNASVFRRKLATKEDEEQGMRMQLNLKLSEWNEKTVCTFGRMCRTLLNFKIQNVLITIAKAKDDISMESEIKSSIYGDSNLQITRHYNNLFKSHSRISHPEKISFITETNSESVLRFDAPLSITLAPENKEPENGAITECKMESCDIASLRQYCKDKTMWQQKEGIFKLIISLCEEQSGSKTKMDIVQFLSLFFYEVRCQYPLLPHARIEKMESLQHAKKYDSTVEATASVLSKSFEMVPVLWDVKSPCNVTTIIQLMSQMQCNGFNILIHVLNCKNFSHYRNEAFKKKIVQSLGPSSSDSISISFIDSAKNSLLRSQFFPPPNASVEEAEHKSSDKARVHLLVMTGTVFCEWLALEKQYLQHDIRVLILETVCLNKDAPPIDLHTYRFQFGKRYYGVIGRENIGIKPKWLYQIVSAATSRSESRTTLAQQAEDENVAGSSRECQVVYVATSQVLPSLNAAIAGSVLLWSAFKHCTNT
ncbi:hypothetical protein RFI_14157 [Reticulomyxa filosa]|uniref:Uncharacterized protein n=1 Tax=Reticulomyxa filosa TaxID=46433 RepID=X6NCI5_RETFI|nr:hypothetical protein RFI_14157 [Reticulomyxa filosa]|eukprot:ETO23032.1 hypothetical protein RFI_14157 [Reticulomyxa filosa]